MLTSRRTTQSKVSMCRKSYFWIARCFSATASKISACNQQSCHREALVRHLLVHIQLCLMFRTMWCRILSVSALFGPQTFISSEAQASHIASSLPMAFRFLFPTGPQTWSDCPFGLRQLCCGLPQAAPCSNFRERLMLRPHRDACLSD